MTPQPTPQRPFSLWSGLSLCLASLALIVALIAYLGTPDRPAVVTVNLTRLIQQEAKQLQATPLSLAEQQAVIAQFSQRLQAVLQTVAARDHVVILRHSAVLTGVPDWTQAVARALESQGREKTPTRQSLGVAAQTKQVAP